jgi:large conductance mechanosensitive channel
MLPPLRDVTMTRAAQLPGGQRRLSPVAVGGQRGFMHRRDRMIKEFREFLFRGNVVDLAVAVVIGAAFGAIITSLVEDILTPLLGLVGVPDFSTWVIEVGDAEMRIGLFLNALISFVLIAAAIFFVVVKPMQAMQAARAREDEAEEEGPSEIDLLTDIRDELRKAG